MEVDGLADGLAEEDVDSDVVPELRGEYDPEALVDTLWDSEDDTDRLPEGDVLPECVCA